MFCAKCGASLPDDAVFCGRCGNKVLNLHINDADSGTETGHDVDRRSVTEYLPRNEQKKQKKKGKETLPVLIALLAFALIGTGIFLVL